MGIEGRPDGCEKLVYFSCAGCGSGLRGQGEGGRGGGGEGGGRGRGREKVILREGVVVEGEKVCCVYMDWRVGDLVWRLVFMGLLEHAVWTITTRGRRDNRWFANQPLRSGWAK